jgi:hypothetical protein
VSNPLQLRLIAKEVVADCDNLFKSSLVRYSFKLAEAYLAEHPADDETLVDLAWLDTYESRKIGPNEREILDAESGTSLRITFGKKTTVSVSDHDGHYCRLHGLYGDVTSGDFRRLVKALKIDLKEGQS